MRDFLNLLGWPDAPWLLAANLCGLILPFVVLIVVCVAVRP